VSVKLTTSSVKLIFDHAVIEFSKSIIFFSNSLTPLNNLKSTTWSKIVLSKILSKLLAIVITSLSVLTGKSLGIKPLVLYSSYTVLSVEYPFDDFFIVMIVFQNKN
jgi:hypothetical protein